MKKHDVIFFILVLLSVFDFNAQTILIPDRNFEQALIDLEIDSDGVINGSVLTKDINTITSLNISDKTIKNLTGIADFEALEVLNCSDNLLNNIDVSALDSLTELNCSSNRLSELNVSSLDSLKNLNCANNRLSILNVSKNKVLKFLLCSSNQLTKITTNTEPNEDLTIFDCSNNQLINLDVSQFKKLNNLSCSKNQLEELDLSENDTLTILDASNNRLIKLDVTLNKYLETLTCASNQLTELDLSENDTLTILDASNNRLIKLDVTLNKYLETLTCASNQLTELNLTDNVYLRNLSVNNNLITELDLSTMNTVECPDEQPEPPESKELCQDASSINVSKNQLVSLILSNGYNSLISSFNAENNPDLFCIQIDDGFNTPDNWVKDAFASYSINCKDRLTAIPDSEFEAYLESMGLGDDIGNNNVVLTERISGITSLDVSGKSITDLTGIEDFTALQLLDCSNNNLTTLNLIQNFYLRDLNCSNNNISTLKFSTLESKVLNKNLRTINCSFNNVTSLDLSNNSSVKELNCSNNQNLSKLVLYDKIQFNELAEPDSRCSLNSDGTYNCPENPLQKLNVSSTLLSIIDDILLNNPLLIELECESANLNAIDLSKSVLLNKLNCADNTLTSLNLSNNLALTSLNCSNNALAELDLGNNLQLSALNCSSSSLTELLLTNNISLNKLNCSFNPLTALHLSSNVLLEELTCNSTDVNHLNLSNNSKLKTVECTNNTLVSLINIKNHENASVESFDATSNPNLTCVVIDNGFTPSVAWQIGTAAFNCELTYVPDNHFEAYLETHNENGELVSIGDLTSMGNGILNDHYVPTAKIETITTIDISYQEISDLRGIESFIAIENLNCSNNFITNLDLRNNSSLTTINCSNNDLISLNINNGQNDLITYFDARNNDILICIQVDDVNIINEDWQKDEDASYSETDCGLTYVPDVNFETYLETHKADLTDVPLGDPGSMGDGVMNNFVPTANITGITELDISGNSIHNLTGIEDFTNLQILDCQDNNLINFDISNNVNLLELSCQNSKVSALDLSKNILLKQLDCSGNPLNQLELTNNTDLTNLTCRESNLIELILSNNTELVEVDCSNNFLTELNLNTNNKLTSLDCSKNNLMTLIIKNTNITNFNATSNPNLYCIEVDNVNEAKFATGWDKDDIAEYSEDCSSRKTEIKDDNFEAYLEANGMGDNIEGNDYVLTSNIESILELDVNEKGIYDLKGIAAFKALVSLTCSSNYLSALDVSNNLRLKKLICGDNQLTDSSLTLNTAIEELVCDSNYFTELNLSLNTALRKLDMSSNNISEIDFSQNLGLTELYCGNNFIDGLVLTANTLLIKLNCVDNLISELNLNSNTALKVLDCSNNDLETLDISSNINIEALNCDSNKITELVFNDYASYVSFEALSCNDNLLEDLNVSKFDNLNSLSCSSNQLDVLNLSLNSNLMTLNMSNNYFETIDLSNNSNLKWLDCSNNKLSSLDLSSNDILEELNGDNNQLKGIYLGDNLIIKKISCASNTLEILNLADYTSLEELNIRDNELAEFSTNSLVDLKSFNCSSNQITELDMSFNSVLEDLNCSDNELWTLNIKNGNNGILETMNATNNLDLLCIQVDNENNISDNWQKDEDATYSDNCHYFETYVPDDAFEQALIDLNIDTSGLDDYVNTNIVNAITNLPISNYGIEELTGIEDFITLQVLDISGNQIDRLNLSNNVDLIELYAANNTLDSIDLSNNSAIEILDVSNNELSELYTGNLINLISLDCHTNQLVDLDMSLNNALTFLDCSFNVLFSLNIQNGNNAMLSELNASNNPHLTCIEADFESPPDSTLWQKDDTASYSQNCHYYQTYVPDDAFEAKLDPNGVIDDYVSTSSLAAIENLNVNSSGISDLTGLEALVHLKVFSCQNNNITTMDLSNNLLLESLNGYGNQIESLDISFLDNLKNLFVSNNNLANIDVSSNLALSLIDISQNELDSLNLSSNINLKTLNCSSNQLSRLYINNGFNEKIIAFDCTDNPYLYCILVDDPEQAFALDNWFKDDQASFNLVCDDDDNDGVTNDEDLCENTPFGTTVDLFGCPFYSLSNDNFTILITGETCLSSNNGKVNITAKETYSYTATITGTDYLNNYKFTNDVEIRNLRQGRYQLCITVEEWSGYSSCYEIVISEPEPLAVITNKSTKNKKVSLDMSGSSNYHINLNGFKFSTSNSNIDLSLKNGYNSIKVSTDLDCQGIYEEQIYMSDGVFVYPNPFDSKINIYLGDSEGKNIEINIYSSLGHLVYSKSFNTHKDSVIVETDGLPLGLFIVSVKTEESFSTFKIVKK